MNRGDVIVITLASLLVIWLIRTGRAQALRRSEGYKEGEETSLRRLRSSAVEERRRAIESGQEPRPVPGALLEGLRLSPVVGGVTETNVTGPVWTPKVLRAYADKLRAQQGR